MTDNIDKLIEELAQEGTPVKRAQHPYVLSLQWIFIALAYLAISLSISGTRHDLWADLHHFWFSAEIAALVAIFITTSLSAALLSYPDLHQKQRIAFAPVVAFALFTFIMLFAWHADSPPAPLPMHSFECTLSITLVSLLPVAWIIFVMRKYASTHSQWAGGIAFLYAFSIGALWLRLYEMNDSIWHVLIWHYLPMIAFGLLGMWPGKKLLKW